MVTTGLAVWILLASIITGILYALDKRAAAKDRKRFPENVLLLWSLAGGWPGGLIAGKWTRHKTRKLSYRLRFGLVVAINIAVVASCVYLAGGW